MSGIASVWMPLYVKDWLTGTVGMTMEQNGCYAQLVMVMWEHGGRPFPDDDEELAMCCRVSVARWRRVLKAKVMAKFELTDEGWMHRRVDAERQKAEMVVRKNSAAGKASARARSSKKQELIETPVASTLQPNRNPSPSPSPSQAPSRKEETESAVCIQPNLGLLTVVADNPRPTGKVAAERKPKPEAPTARAWAAYAEAYRWKYGVDPVRNATTSGQMMQFVRRVGAEEAPAIAGHFLTLSKRFYVESQHPVSLLLKDCESIRTQWATGCSITSTQALQTDRRRAAFEAAEDAIEIMERRHGREAFA